VGIFDDDYADVVSPFLCLLFYEGLVQSDKVQLARQELIYSSIDQLKINGKKKREERKCDKEIK